MAAELAELRQKLAEAEKALHDKASGRASTRAGGGGTGPAMTTRVDQFARPSDASKVLNGKFTAITNRNTKEFRDTLDLSVEQKKKIAGFFEELSEATNPVTRRGGEIVVSKPEAAAAKVELAKIAEDWGIKRTLVPAATPAVTTIILELICIARVLAAKE